MAARIPPNFRRVITAAAGGNVIEWYDFYIFGSLAAILSVKFFEKSHPVAALLSTIALFTAGFLIRPLGAFLFGWMGDRVGRKYTFLVTLSGMALGTGAIGLIPTFDQIGLAAAIILFGLRMIQGLCLGGQYGGAITYVAEHVSDERRGYYTGWLQTSPTLGIVLSLLVIIAVRTYLGDDAFNDWGWRIPFLFSFLLMFIAYYIRVNFQESPIFEEIKAKGAMTKNPWKEAFLSSNIKFVLIATIVVLGRGRGLVQRSVLGAVLLAAGFQAGRADHFLYRWSRADHRDADPRSCSAGSPTIIGRKPVILAGFLLAAVTYYPLYSVARLGRAAGQCELPDCDPHRRYPGRLCRNGVRADRRVPRRIFPGRIRYTSVSVPYHIGNGWGGGLVPFITTAAYTATGSLGYALIYPIAVPAIAFVLSLFLMPETKQMSIWDEAAPQKA